MPGGLIKGISKMIFGYGNKVPEQPPKSDRTPKIEQIDNLTLEVNGKVLVTVKLIDVTEVDTDIIVSPANIYLECTSGVAGQLIMKGGLQI
jgi:hypothetical protein